MKDRNYGNMEESMIKKNTLVSVIVPVYNVELYLDCCIDSIRRQSFKDFELLLVDDGSTDRSGLICKKAAQEDRRIRYFHKENGGLSDTRNYGIRKARGDYLTFIDADDYVADNYLETLVELSLAWSAEISCVDFLMDGEEYKTVKKTGGECISPVEALRRCCIRDGFGLSACGKMYHRSLAGVLCFPLGQRYEDLMTIPYLFEKCDRVACCRERLYFYRKRQGSITHRRLDEEDIRQTELLLRLVDYVDGYAPEIHDAAVCRLVVEVFHNLIYRLVFDDRYPALVRRINKACDKAFKETRSNPYLTKKKKMQVFLLSRLPEVYQKMYLFFKKFI